MPPSSSLSSAAASVRTQSHPCPTGARRARLTNTHHPTQSVYIFIGSILLNHWTLRQIAAAIIGFVGVAYVALELIPSNEPPDNMREAADAGWGAEQV